jgi:hypothetical protein
VDQKFNDNESGWYKSWKYEAQKLLKADKLSVSIKPTRTFSLDEGGWAGAVLLIR